MSFLGTQPNSGSVVEAQLARFGLVRQSFVCGEPDQSARQRRWMSSHAVLPSNVTSSTSHLLFCRADLCQKPSLECKILTK